ncbi:MAG: hypothetical protein M3217_05740 [Actinomycetota bacterium]|nr:hypothetical protein [Actinomycetota bacterium]
MIRTSYLRVYQPISEFSAEERAAWGERTEEAEQDEPALVRKWLLGRALPDDGPAASSADGAFIREVDGTIYVCPWRTRLRMLAGLLAFRTSVPEEVADAFVPEAEARRAAAELAALGEDAPEVRSHILHANWHVPLRWFVAFDETERILTEDRAGLRIRYETTMDAARARLGRAVDVLEGSWIDDDITGYVKELAAWFGEFPADCLVELDYSTVARDFDDEDLVEDQSAKEVWACLDALAAGDVLSSGRIFGKLTERWNVARSREVVN